MSRNYTRENRETSPASGSQPAAGSGREAKSAIRARTPGEESNIGVLPAKPPNKAGGDASGGGGGGKAGD